MSQTILPLSDAITLQRGFDLPTIQRKTGKYPVITSTGRATTHNEARVKAPGVVIGRSGSIGGGQFIQEDFWPLNTTLWVKDFKGNNEKFIYYLLKSIDFSSFNAGAAVPTLNRNHLSMLKVRIPSRTTQDEIADILGTIDDKIELNRRMNDTLEEIGQTLFKHYFTNNTHIKLVPIAELIEFVKGVEPGSKNYAELQTDSNTPFLRVGDMGSRKNEIYVEKKLLKGRIADPKDVLVSFDGAPGLVSVGLQGGYSTGIRKLIAKNTSISNGYIYFLMRSSDIQQTIKNYSEGTTIKHAGKSLNYMIAPVSEGPTSSFLNVVLEQIIQNIEQIGSLTGLRDSLLPRLISGKIKV